MVVFREGNFELLPLTEAKLKGKGEVSWSGVKFIFAGVQEMEGAGEGVDILLNDMMHSIGVEFGCVTSRILWIKFKFSRVKVFVMVGYGQYEKKGEERGL